MNIDNRNGTTIVVAAFTPASIMTIEAMMTNILTDLCGLICI
jgi:hypothetical protein